MKNTIHQLILIASFCTFSVTSLVAAKPEVRSAALRLNAKPVLTDQEKNVLWRQRYNESVAGKIRYLQFVISAMDTPEHSDLIARAHAELKNLSSFPILRITQ